MKKLIIIAAAIAALSSCCCKNAESSIANTAFNIIELNGTEYQSLGDKPAFIAFEDSTCNASVGGNSIFASYKEDKDGKLTLSEGGMTRMMVPAEYREDEFVNAFNSIASYTANSDTVVFLNAEGAELIKAVKVADCCKAASEGCCKAAADSCCKAGADSCCKAAADSCCKAASDSCCKAAADSCCAEGKECCK